MTREEIIKEIESRKKEAIANYYDSINKTHGDNLTAEERTLLKRLADIEYGRTGAFNELLDYLKLK